MKIYLQDLKKNSSRFNFNTSIRIMGSVGSKGQPVTGATQQGSLAGAAGAAGAAAAPAPAPAPAPGAAGASASGVNHTTITPEIQETKGGRRRYRRGRKSRRRQSKKRTRKHR